MSLKSQIHNISQQITSLFQNITHVEALNIFKPIPDVLEFNQLRTNIIDDYGS